MNQRRVWIADGCIECFWCQQLDERIFVRGPSGTEISGWARVDGRTSTNQQEQAPLNEERLSESELNFIRFIADGCPVKVIHLEGESMGSALLVAG
jgi:ferredoxin